MTREEAIRCETCRYDGMCIRQTHTMAIVDNCDRYEEYKERPHGEWLRKNNSNSWFECSVCKEVSDVVTIMREPTWKFCPNCGADMREEGDEK